MKYELSQKFFFEAAHTLQRDIDGESSKRIHGHTYHAKITLAGNPDPSSGMVSDLGHIRKQIANVHDLLDHRFLDEIPNLGHATLENLCEFIYTNLKETLPNIACVTVERKASGDSCSLRM